MANALKDKEANLNPGDADARQRFSNNGEHDRNPDLTDLQRKEETGNLEDDYNAPDPVAQAKAKEEAGWDASGFTGANTQPGPKFTFKKKGPIGALIAIVFGGAFGVAGIFGGPSLLLVQIEETFTGDPRINTQLTSLTDQGNKVLASKFQESTNGVCGITVTIMCKFTRPSNYQLRQMAENNIIVKDASGNILDGKAKLPNFTRPSTLTFIGADGNSKTIQAPELLSALRSDPKFAADFNKSYNPRFFSLVDSFFAKIKARLGFSGRDSLKNVDPGKIDEAITEQALGERSTGTTGSTGTGTGVDETNPSAAVTEIEDDIEKSIEKSLKDVGDKSSKSASAVSMAASIACVAADVPSLLVKVVRDYQVAQFVRYSATFLIVAGAIKAGDANQNETAALGALLTAVVAGKSAMDSFGMRNAMFRDTAIGGDSLWNKYSPGASISASSLGRIGSIFSGSVKQGICTIATSPATQAGIDVAADGTIVAGIVNTVIGVGGGLALSQFAGPIAGLVAKAIPASAYEDILSAIAGDALTGLKSGGMGVGDALASGAENMLSQTASVGGNMPLSVADAVAYGKQSDEVAAQYAQIDRATYSPLDASNPNTALGSFVNQFMPYLSDMSSMSGVASMISGVVGSSFSTILNPLAASAADPSAEYTMCQDPTITASGTAATPFCAVINGIPAKWSNIPVTQVVSDLVASGDIDATTGEVKTDADSASQTLRTIFGDSTSSISTNYSDWLTMCTDGSTTPIVDTTNNCSINNQQTAEYALYTIRNRARIAMDGEDPDITGNSSGDSAASANSGSSNTRLFAMLDSFNQPALPSMQAKPIPTIQPAPTKTIATIVGKFQGIATSQKSTVGLIA
jgi:hypothetical protein